MNPSSIAPIIQECERIIANAVRRFHLKVNPGRVVVTVQSGKARGKKADMVLGWFCAESWAQDKDAIHELNVVAERLRMDPWEVAGVILHELAHAENKTCGIQDTSVTGVHNRKFRDMAERLGLTVQPRNSTTGFGQTSLGSAARAFLVDMKFDPNIFRVVRVGAPELEKKKRSGSKFIKWRCGCGEDGVLVRTTNDQLDAECHKCGEPYQMEEEEED